MAKDKISRVQSLLELTTPVASLMDIPTGIVGFRTSARLNHATGFPTAMSTYLFPDDAQCYGRIIGGWQGNGNYQGIIIFTSDVLNNNVWRIFTMTYATSSGLWGFSSLDNSKNFHS